MYLFVALVGQIASESGQTCLVGQSQDLFVGTIVWKFPICLVARYISQCQSHRWVDTSSFEDDWDAASTGFIVPICPNPCKFGMINPRFPLQGEVKSTSQFGSPVLHVRFFQHVKLVSASSSFKSFAPTSHWMLFRSRPTSFRNPRRWFLMASSPVNDSYCLALLLKSWLFI